MNSDFRSVDDLIFHRHGVEGGQGIPLDHRLYSGDCSINAEVVIFLFAFIELSQSV